MSGHTPGPWRAVRDPSHYDSITDIVDGEGRAVAQTIGQRQPMEANACLIAAAPEMYAALKRITQIQNQEYGGDWDEIEEARNIAFAALAAVTPPPQAVEA